MKRPNTWATDALLVLAACCVSGVLGAWAGAWADRRLSRG